MAKQKKSQRVSADGETILVDPPKNVGDKEQYQRLNYLYQLAMWATMHNSNDRVQSMARMYSKTMDLVSKKTNTKMLPTIKRTVCKQCHRLQIPNKTSSVVLQRHKKPHATVLEVHCRCGRNKRFPIGANVRHQTFYEKENRLLELTATDQQKPTRTARP